MTDEAMLRTVAYFLWDRLVEIERGIELSVDDHEVREIADAAVARRWEVALVNDDGELMRFDLRQKRFPAGGVRLALKATHHGVCAGVAQWIKLELDAHATYENRPSPRADFNNHWTHIVHRFPRLVTVAPVTASVYDGCGSATVYVVDALVLMIARPPLYCR